MKEPELEFFAPTPRQRELQILIEIDREPQISQKDLAIRVGLAPSMVNNYMKNLCQAEKVVKRGPNHKRITYHLTEAGRQMKAELLSRYLLEGLRLYHALSEDLRGRLRGIQQDGISRVMLLGAAEACEAIERAAREVGMEVVAVTQAMSQSSGGASARSASVGPERAQAVLVAGAPAEEPSPAILDGLRQRGLTVYRV